MMERLIKSFVINISMKTHIKTLEELFLKSCLANEKYEE